MTNGTPPEYERITAKDVSKLARAAKNVLKEAKVDVFTYALWFTFFVGLKSGELISLKIGDVVFDEKGIPTKLKVPGSRAREFNLPHQARRLLIKYFKFLKYHRYKAHHNSPLLQHNRFGSRYTKETFRRHFRSCRAAVSSFEDDKDIRITLDKVRQGGLIFLYENGVGWFGLEKLTGLSSKELDAVLEGKIPVAGREIPSYKKRFWSPDDVNQVVKALKSRSARTRTKSLRAIHKIAELEIDIEVGQSLVDALRECEDAQKGHFEILNKVFNAKGLGIKQRTYRVYELPSEVPPVSDTKSSPDTPPTGGKDFIKNLKNVLDDI